MIKKRALLISLLLVPSVLAITSESLLQTYMEFYGWFDFLIYLLIFTGVTKLALESAFKKTGEESKAVSLLYIGLGLLFSISLVTWEIKSGFYLYQLGPLILVLIIIFILAWLAKLIKSRKKGEKQTTWPALRYISLFLLLLIIIIYALFPQILYFSPWSTWSQEALAIIGLISLIILILSFTSKEEAKEKGESWWEKRKKKKAKEIEPKQIQEKKEKEELTKLKKKEEERIKAIGKIRCYIYVKSREQNRVLDNNDEIRKTDELTFDAIIENASDEVNYTWNIAGRKIKTPSFKISAARLGKGRSRVRLLVRDLTTGYKSEDSIILKVIEEEKALQKIIKEVKKPFTVKILAPDRGIFTENERLVLGILFPERKPRLYKIEWNVSGIKTTKETFEINTSIFKWPGKKKIKLKVKDLETREIARDTFTFVLHIEGKKTKREKLGTKITPIIKSGVAKTKEKIKYIRTKRKARKVLKLLNKLKKDSDNQKSYVTTVYTDLGETHKKIRLKPNEPIIELLDKAIAIEEKIQKNLNKIYNNLSYLAKDPNEKIRNASLNIQLNLEILRFKEISPAFKSDIPTALDKISDNIAFSKYNEAYEELSIVLVALQTRTKGTSDLIEKSKSLITYLKTK